MQRRLIGFVGVLLLVSCGGAAPSAQAPTPARVVVTQVVRQTVIVPATVLVKQTVVVTATPIPPPAAPAETATPTADPAVTARVTRTAKLFKGPDEGYASAADLAAGDVVTVDHRGGQWFEVTTAADAVGWLYKDWIDLPADAAEKIPIYPKALPVIVGKVVQEALGGSTVFKGRIYNVGAKTAYQVKVEIETFDAADNRVDLVLGYADDTNIAPDGVSSFQAITSFEYDTYVPALKWNTTP